MTRDERDHYWKLLMGNGTWETAYWRKVEFEVCCFEMLQMMVGSGVFYTRDISLLCYCLLMENNGLLSVEVLQAQ